VLRLANRSALGAALFALTWFAFPPQADAVEGAFGLRFDTPLMPQQLGASRDASLLTSLLIDQPEIQQQQKMTGWHAFSPEALPLRLSSMQAQMVVQTTDSGKPAWIAASFSSQQCSADLVWLRDVLKKKYGQPDLSIRRTSEHSRLSESFSERLLFEFDNVVVAAGCGLTAASTLQIEYWHRATAPTLQQAQQLRDDATKTLAEERTQAADRLGKLRDRAVASSVATGSRYKIEQVFGIAVERTVKTPGNFVVDEFIDYPLQGVSPPYRGQTARVQLGPTGHLIRFELKIADVQAAEFKRLQGALEQQFAQPTKATSKHVIFTVGADYLVLRRRAEQLEFTLISGTGEKGLKSRQLAAQEKQWQIENAGI
jgi:hypothetical protein